MHRIGRTARAGRDGKSLILLNEHEDSYIDFLQAKTVEIEELPGDYVPVDTKPVIQEAMKLDREIIDRSSDAFVSYIRYYKEHQLQYIFNMLELDIGAVANSFCLFRLPRVREILGKRIEGFV